MEYRFIVETTKIENTSFPFKTALSEANVKTNRMATAKWTYHKERDFVFIVELLQDENMCGCPCLSWRKVEDNRLGQI